MFQSQTVMVVVYPGFQDQQVLTVNMENLANPVLQECQEPQAEELAAEAPPQHQHQVAVLAQLDHPDHPDLLEIQVITDPQAKAAAVPMELLVNLDPRDHQDLPENQEMTVLLESPVLLLPLALQLLEIPDQLVIPDPPVQLDLLVHLPKPEETVPPGPLDLKAHPVKLVLMEPPDQPDLPETPAKPERKASVPNTALWTEECSSRMARDDKLLLNGLVPFHLWLLSVAGHFCCLYRAHLSYNHFVFLKVYP